MEFKIKKRLSRKDIIIGIFSICLSIIGILTLSFFKSSLDKDVIRGLSARVVSIKHFFVFIVLSLFFNFLFRQADKIFSKTIIYEKNSTNNKDIFVKSFLFNILCWGVWFYVYFPGAGMNDTINCIMSFHDDIQPLAYQLIVYYGIHGLSAITHNMTISYAVLTCIQMILMSLVLAGVVNWLNKKKIRKLFINLIILYYALMPAVADYSITLIKDTLYGLCILTLIPLMYELLIKQGEPIRNKKFFFCFFVSLLGMSVLRSNGKYIVAITLGIFIFMKIKNKFHFLILLILLVLVNIVLGIGERKIIVNDTGFRESIGVPLAQIGGVLVMDGFISDQDREVLNRLLPLDIWKDQYDYSYADLIKFNNNFDNQWLNDNKGAFIHTWFSVLKENLRIYVKAYLCHTYGLWNIAPLNITSLRDEQSYFTKINNNTGDDSFWGEYCKANNLTNCPIEPDTVRAQLDSLFKSMFRVSLVLGSGIMFWMSVGLGTELVIYKKYRICCVLIPIVLNWVTMMIATPASFIYRYGFYLVLSLPILLLITLMEITVNKVE